MSDDLVQRLRAWDVWELDKGPPPPPTSFGEAADRIEELEAALRNISSRGPEGVLSGADAMLMKQIAYRALEGKP